MKKCLICDNEFENKSRGTEQLYCSSSCRAVASKKRQQEKMINYAKQEIEKKQRFVDDKRVDNDVEQSSEYAESVGRIQGGKVSVGNNGGPFADNYGKDYIEKYYEARIDNNSLILKNQYLEDKVKQLEKEVFDLNSEIDVLESAKEDGGMLGNITEQFVKNPMETAKFVSALFESFKVKK